MSYQPPPKLSLLGHSYYFIRLQVALVIVELTMLALFRFYPAQDDSAGELSRFSSESESPVVMEDVVITEQNLARSVAPPVRQDLPPEPTDDLMEMEPIDFEGMEPLNDSPIANIQNTGIDDSGELKPVANPDIPPRLYKIVEPVIPEEARKSNVKARIRVSFLISPEGKVEDLYITKIEVYDRQKQKFVIQDRIGYGLAEATMKAASKWQFGPAKNGGNTVPARVEHMFTFGFD